VDKDQISNILKEKQQYFNDTFGIKFLGIFGSYSRDEALKSSDIDILYKIQDDKKLSLFNYLKAIKELEGIFQNKIDLIRDETLKPKMKTYIEKDLIYV
jgi:predicted nucleotidyltransferase